MGMTIQEVSADVYDAPEAMTDTASRSAQPPVDMDRVRRELRREVFRLERLWAD